MDRLTTYYGDSFVGFIYHLIFLFVKFVVDYIWPGYTLINVCVVDMGHRYQKHIYVALFKVTIAECSIAFKSRETCTVKASNCVVAAGIRMTVVQCVILTFINI